MNNVLDEFEVEKRGIDASFYLKMIALALAVLFLDCILVMFYFKSSLDTLLNLQEDKDTLTLKIKILK